MNFNPKQFLFLLRIALTIQLTCGQFCPRWSCSDQGTFSLDKPAVTRTAAKLVWTWSEKMSVQDKTDYRSVGCVSSVTTVVCPTSVGVVSLDATTGVQHWFCHTHNNNSYKSFVPTVAIQGGAIVSGSSHFGVIDPTGTLLKYIDLSHCQPWYGVMWTLSDQHVFVSTCSNVTGPQLITFGGDDVSEQASVNLKEKIRNVQGTFIPWGNPVMNDYHNRIYISTKFIPDNMKDPGAEMVWGIRRLFAIDLSGIVPNIKWSMDLTQDIVYTSRADDYLSFYSDTVYVSYKISYQNSNQKTNKAKHKQKRQPPPPTGLICAVKDLGNLSKLIFSRGDWKLYDYGQMAVFDGSAMSQTNVTVSIGNHVFWVRSEKFPSRLLAFDAVTGAFLTTFLLNEVDGIKNNTFVLITTDISVTRLMEENTDNADILVFGAMDWKQCAYLVAIEARLPPLKPCLLWAVDVSGSGNTTEGLLEQNASIDSGTAINDSGSSWQIRGQISYVDVYSEIQAGSGLVVSVVEQRDGIDKDFHRVHIKMLM